MTTTTIHRRAVGRLAAVATAVILLAAACASDSEETSTSDAASSPLAEFLGQGDFLSDPDAAQARFAEEERERQEVIASCMQAQGFEYTPVDYGQFDTFSEDIDDYGSDEWVAEWGFGITTQRFSQQQVGPNLKGWEDVAMEEGIEEEFEDPNQDYVQSLSEEEQQAYNEALYGDMADPFAGMDDESMTDEEREAIMEDFTFEPSGCEGEAFGEDAGFAFYQAFEDELEQMEERIQSDSRITALRQEIESCVSDKGLVYTDMEAMYERFEKDLSEMDPYANGFEPDFGISEEEMAQMSEEELDEFFSNQTFTEPELSEEDKAKLGELQEEEIALAVAVNECGGGWEKEYEAQAEVRAEYEQEFLDANADRLEEYRAG